MKSARPAIELMPVAPPTVLLAAWKIVSCEFCHKDAEIRFDCSIAEVTRKHARYEFLLTAEVRCPDCVHVVTEKTLIQPPQPMIYDYACYPEFSSITECD